MEELDFGEMRKQSAVLIYSLRTAERVLFKSRKL